MEICQKACKYGACTDFPLKGLDVFIGEIVVFEVSSIDGVWRLQKVLIFLDILWFVWM